MNPLIIILGIIIIIILFFIIKYYYFNTKALVTNINLKNNPVDISSSVITNPSSVLYTFATWIYVNNFGNTRIISYSNGPANEYFSLILGGVDQIGTPDTPTLTAVINMNTIKQKITMTRNFPIQKWVHVTISVDTNFVDCYLDGKLTISKQFATGPLTGQEASIHFGNYGSLTNPDIYLCKVIRWDHPLDPQSVWNEYSSGNGLSTNNLAVDLTVTTDDTKNSYSIYSNK